MNIKDTNGDIIQIVTGIGGNRIYLDGGYALNHIFNISDLYSFLGKFLSKDKSAELLDTNNELVLRIKDNFIDMFYQNEKIKIPRASLSLYMAKKLHNLLKEKYNLKNNVFKTRTFQAYSDPAHAWVKVNKSLLKKYKIDKLISRSSYVNGDYCFLEEDSDLSIFVNALKENNIHPIFKTRHTNKYSKIRSYNSYSI